jgi:RsiW-degrading membrane proteinase PrsW (M82 family)
VTVLLDSSRSAGVLASPTRRHAWMPLLAGGVGLFALLRHALISTQNPNLLPSLILVGAAVVPAAFLAFLYGRRLAYSVSGGVLALTALVGGVVGVVVAGSLEYRTLVRLGTLPMSVVGLAEETAKLLVPAGLLLVARYRRPANGLLIGVASGAGFAALETMGYAFVALIRSGGNLAVVDGTLVLRGLLSPAAHMTWTGLTAAALWHAASRGWHVRPVAHFVVVFLATVGLHAAWDSIGTFVGYTVISAISLALLYATTHGLAVAARDAAPPAPASSPGPQPAVSPLRETPRR